MRHQLSGRQLSRNAPHRQAMLRNMAASLLRHETIRTTVPKAKAESKAAAKAKKVEAAAAKKSAKKTATPKKKAGGAKKKAAAKK